MEGEEDAGSPSEDAAAPKRKGSDMDGGNEGDEDLPPTDDADELVKSFMQSVNLLDLKNELGDFDI